MTGRRIGVGTGFIVYNERTYPLLTRLFARQVLDHGDPGGQVLADFLRTGGFSRYFTAHFALPLVAAVWSCPSGTALRYPARYLFAFLANPQYADYVARTSGFIPLPPKRAPRRSAAAATPPERA